jgi:hypothetical protein
LYGSTMAVEILNGGHIFVADNNKLERFPW